MFRLPPLWSHGFQDVPSALGDKSLSSVFSVPKNTSLREGLAPNAAWLRREAVRGAAALEHRAPPAPSAPGFMLLQTDAQNY